jgi:CheY-like chemotaxis protein
VILIVDDVEDTREVMCRVIGAKGFPCQAVTNGREALAFIRSYSLKQPLLVLMDVMMPEISGIEALRQIRADPQIEQTPVIMFSAGFNIALRDEAISLRASARIFKGADAGFDEICQWYQRVGGVRSESKSRPN